VGKVLTSPAADGGGDAARGAVWEPGESVGAAGLAAGMGGGGARDEPVARRYHVHSVLLMYCAVSLLLAVGAFNSNNNLMFWMFALAFSMIIVSGLISGPMLMGVRVERVGVTEAVEGSAARFTYRVRNTNRWVPAFALTVEERGEGRGGGGGAGGSGSGRGPPRGARLDEGPRAFVAHVGAGQTVTVEGVCRAEGRGVMRLVEIVVTSDFPFGIVRKSLRFVSPGLLIVRPRPEGGEAPSLAVDARSRLMSEATRQRERAMGDEFFALREYQPGDSPRSIAWRATARAAPRDGGGGGAELLVRQTTASAPGRLEVLLDLTGAPDEAAYERAIRRATGLVRGAEREGVRVGLLVRGPWATEGDGDRVERLGDARTGRWHAARLRNELALLPAFRAEPERAGATGGYGALPGHVVVVSARDGPDASNGEEGAEG